MNKFNRLYKKLLISSILTSCILFSAIGQQSYKALSVIPFEGINIESAITKKAFSQFTQVFLQNIRFQYIDYKDFGPKLIDSGFEKVDVLNETDLVNLGDYLNLDYIIVGIIGKGYDSYTLQIKIIGIQDIDIIYDKTLKVGSIDEIYLSINTIATELIKDTEIW